MCFIHKSTIQKFLNERGLTDAFNFLHEHGNTYLVDETLSDCDVILIALFLRESLLESTAEYKIRLIFESFGCSTRSWDNAATEAVKAGYVEVYEDYSKKEYMRLLIRGLKRIEDIFGRISATKHHIIKSGEAFTAKKLFEDFLKAEIEKGVILLCDPYISPSTLYPFSELSGKVDSLKILTANILEKGKFEKCLTDLKDETEISVEVRINRKIHDRYLISEKRCWTIGTSIKDLGNKDCIIKEVSDIVQSLSDLFWERWEEKASKETQY